MITLGRKPVKKTAGELLFEEYLCERKLSFNFEGRHLGKRKRPDYSIVLVGEEFLFDVKDFATKDFPKHAGFYDPLGPIRRKIDEAEEKFQEFRQYSCSLAFYNEGAPLIHLSDPLIVFGAMFGNPGFTIPIDTRTGAPSGPTTAAFLDGGKMIHSRKRRPRIDHISSVITLRRINVGSLRLDRYLESLPRTPQLTPREKAIALLEHLDTVELPFDMNAQEVGVIVWENTFALRQLPDALFSGPFDERWTLRESGCRLSYRGPELAKLKDVPQNGTTQ